MIGYYEYDYDFETKLLGFFFSINDSNPSMYDVMSMKLLETPTEQNNVRLKVFPELVLGFRYIPSYSGSNKCTETTDFSI